MRTLLLIALVLLVGCASAPRKADTVQTAATDTPKALANANKREFKPPTGFKTKILGWSIVYCKKTPVLGSRFPKEICMSEAQLKDHMATNDSMRRQKDQASRICDNPAACGNEG